MDKRVCIYAMTHKRFDESNMDLYKPLFVGAKGKKDTYGYIRDDEGDNISERNCYYSELTGMYWVYKNVTDMDIVGCCHYRRYLIDEKVPLSQLDSLLLIADGDHIVWAVGMRISAHYKITAATKRVLKLTFTDGRDRSADQDILR